MQNSQPSLLNSINNFEIIQEKPFTIHISESFCPQDMSLKYYLLKPTPTWMDLDTDHGFLHGTAPKVHGNKVFKINITAGNNWGFVTKSFIITVIGTDVVDTIPTTLINILSMKTQNYGLRHITLLEYMYVFYEQPENQAQLQNFLQKAAEKHQVKLEKTPQTNYENFEKVILAINPQIEKYLSEQLSKETQSALFQLSTEEFSNLVRMGSQQQGSYAIPVWNYAGYPDLSNWGEILTVYSTVLKAASDDVYRARQRNIPTLKNTPYK